MARLHAWVRYACQVLVCASLALFARPAHAANQRVRIQLRWQHQFQFAGLYVALDRGYYRELGYDVELIENTGEKNAIEEVMQGRAEYGVGSSDLIVARAHGQKVVALAPIFQHSPLVLIALRSGKIDSVHDLAGKRVAMEHEAADLIAYLKSEALVPGAYVPLPHAQNVGALLHREVEAMSAYSTDEPFELLQAREDVRIFSPRAGGIDFYGDTLFTSEVELKANENRVHNIRAATLRGWNDALRDQSAAIDAVLKRSTRHSRAHLEYEAKQSEPLIAPDIIEIGYTNPARWQHIADTYASLGLVPSNLSLSGFLYQQPNPPIPAWVWRTLAGTIAASLAIALAWLRAHRLSIALDQARKREALAAEERMKSQQRLVAMLSHEFRNPLAGIGRAANLLEVDARASEEGKKQRLAGIRTQVQRLTVLVDSILLSEPTGHEPRKPQRETIRVRALLEEMRERLTAEMAARVQLDVAPSDLATEGDPRLLHLALSNLVDNALRYAPLESMIQVEAKQSEGAIAIAVLDRGPGVPEAELKELGMPYHQSARPHGGKQGTGLGYYFCKRIVEEHGGTLTPSNRADGGLCVAMHLPG
jgi:signal transduction histidine kinase